MKSLGTLYLLPVHLDESGIGHLPAVTLSTARRLTCFIVENAKSARAFLKAIATPVPQPDLRLQVLDEHTDEHDVEELLRPLLDGNDVGLMSEAGCPGVADPGSPLVRLAHQRGIKVVPLTGPSSILLALMASGMNGQRFRFHGYLSRDKQQRRDQLKALEKEVSRTGETQIFIETPYRNEALSEDLAEVLSPETLLCVACDLTATSEYVRTQMVSGWKKNRPELNKRPCVFLIGSAVTSKPTKKANTPSLPRRRR